MTTVNCTLCTTVFDADQAVIVVKDGHQIVRCPVCGLVSRASLPAPADIAELYGTEYFAATEGSLGHEGYLDYVADEDVHRANARRRLARIRRFVEPGNLLDVGCAAGFFVDEARRAGWAARGVDVSEEMVTWGQNRLRANLRVGTLADLPQERAASCVTMWDYLEHALDPRTDLVRARAHLRPGGILALSTGDIGSLLARVSLERWHLLTPRHHNYFFSATTLRRVLASVDLEVVALGHSGSSFPIRYLAHKAALVIDRRPVRAAARALATRRPGCWVIPVNLGDVMTVIARRPYDVGPS
jgi:2-polyprenyl-3-methyl-5-hydroxy-6-metoxy-1,4-benzoquinol methylase